MKTLGVIDSVGAATHQQFDAVRSVGGDLLIHRVVRRVSDAERIDEVAVIVSPAMDAALRHVIPLDARVIVSDADDPMARLVAAAERMDAEAIVRVDLHSPFVDPDLLDGLVAAADQHADSDYIGYRAQGNGLRSLSQIGLCGEWCRVSALRSTLRNSEKRKAPFDSDRSDEENVLTLCLLSHPELFQLRFIPVPIELERDDLRLRLNEQQDWDTADELIEALGPEELSWHGITSLLDRRLGKQNAGRS